MIKKIISSIIISSLVFSFNVVDDFDVVENSIVIKFSDNFAPKLGLEAPLTMDQVFGLQDLDQNNNFDNFEPLFRHYDTFSERHHNHDLQFCF